MYDSRLWKSWLLAQPPRMGFQAVIKSAASAASPADPTTTEKISKSRGFLTFLGLYIGIPIGLEFLLIFQGSSGLRGRLRWQPT